MLKINDIWDILGSIGVDFQVSKKITKEQLTLFVKFKNKCKKKLSKEQLKSNKTKIGYINTMIRELRTFVKLKEQKSESKNKELENDLEDLNELREIDKKLVKYKKWKLSLKEGSELQNDLDKLMKKGEEIVFGKGKN